MRFFLGKYVLPRTKPGTPITALLLAFLSSGAIAQEFECFFEPHLVVRVGSPVAGILESVDVDRGDEVSKGQVIAQLRSDVEKATANLAKARADFDTRRMVRNENLYRDELLSDHDRDEIATQALISDLEYQQSMEVLNERVIRSPVSGIVVERFLSPGEYVQVDSIVQLAQIDPLNVEVIIPATHFGMIRIGQRVPVIPAEPVGGEYTGTVTVVDPVIDAASGTFGVRLELPNRNHEVPAGLKCTVLFSPTPR
jgi:RND family efflux transporter MFP subunit